jgi:hypothetical protein
MKATMVIPSYWGRESSVGWQEGDAIYDHPTPLDDEGTLQRALESTAVLNDTDFTLAVLAVPTSEDIAEDVEKKVASIISTVQPNSAIELVLFGQSHLSRIHTLLDGQGRSEYIHLLKLRGYSPVRNLCLFLPHILGSEIAVLIDDDEVFEDPGFISKARNFVGSSVDGHEVNAVAGYYLQPDGKYLLNKSFRPWMRYWDKYSKMDEAFEHIIGTEPRLKETPFVFGGNMIVHRKLFTAVPFDPHVTRGEDIDFLINARMFGFTFFLDNQLSIKHLAPPKSHPTWMQVREDIYRFVYERAKINSQHDVDGMRRVSPEDFDPYPGCFFRNDLEEKVEKACRLLSEEYSSEGKETDSAESLQNSFIARTDAVPKHNPFQKLCFLQKLWKDLMDYSARKDVSSNMKTAIGR